MKKFIILIGGLLFVLALCLLSSCGKDSYYNKQDGGISIDGNEYTYHGCEYVVFSSGSNAWGSHKGDCSNPIHERCAILAFDDDSTKRYTIDSVSVEFKTKTIKFWYHKNLTYMTELNGGGVLFR